MIGQFFDTGFEGIATYVDCWPCEKCGKIVDAGVACRWDDGSVCELEAFCDDCDKKDSGNGYTFIRTSPTRRFELSSGEQGWWS